MICWDVAIATALNVYPDNPGGSASGTQDVPPVSVRNSRLPAAAYPVFASRNVMSES